ncbi:MAG TPA: hypothetical protein VJU78_08795 [Chitinophagaceae bacterium]|nr:hypothetical protein [Chitinophagaceae bacterium]
MSKRDFISGSIFEIQLPFGFGFAYCKVVDFRYIRTFDGVLAKVFDFIVNEPVKDITILSEHDWLFGARRMSGLPGTRGSGSWKSKGVLIGKDDNVIPDFKYSVKDSPTENDESKLGPWKVIRNLNQSNDNFVPYESVKHLEDTVVNSMRGIETRAAMEHCRINNLVVKDFFDLSIPRYGNIYRQMINVPIYKTIPKEIRGKALVSI